MVLPPITKQFGSFFKNLALKLGQQDPLREKILLETSFGFVVVFVFSMYMK